MDQKKIGSFLKSLRKEKGITQEQLAEVLGVSGRTVSRWETGYNMPDLDVLIIIADYYGVEIRELIDGERKSETVDKEIKETVMKVSDYASYEKEKLSRRMRRMFLAGFAAFTVNIILTFSGLTVYSAGDAISSWALGFAYGTMLVGVLYTGGQLAKLKNIKMKYFKKLQ